VVVLAVLRHLFGTGDAEARARKADAKGACWHGEDE
jgi:hypothetical protein